MAKRTGQAEMWRSLADARAEVMAGRGKGTVCPCCDVFVKVYRWRFIPRFQRVLLALYRVTRHGDFVRYDTLVGIRGQAASVPSWLRHWGLVEQGGSARSGLWRVTPLGIDVIEGRSPIARFVYTFRRECVDQSDERVWLRDIWAGEPFDLNEMYLPTPPPHGEKNGGH